MRLIDANVLWERIDNEPWFDNADRDMIALPIVDAIPTVDAKIVVRCKDCEYSYDEISYLAVPTVFALIAKCRRISTAQKGKERRMTNDSSRSTRTPCLHLK